MALDNKLHYCILVSSFKHSFHHINVNLIIVTNQMAALLLVLFNDYCSVAEVVFQCHQ